MANKISRGETDRIGFEGHMVHITYSGLMEEKEWIWRATGRDTQTNETAESGPRKSSEGSIEHALRNLLVKQIQQQNLRNMETQSSNQQPEQISERIAINYVDDNNNKPMANKLSLPNIYNNSSNSNNAMPQPPPLPISPVPSPRPGNDNEEEDEAKFINNILEKIEQLKQKKGKEDKIHLLEKLVDSFLCPKSQNPSKHSSAFNSNNDNNTNNNNFDEYEPNAFEDKSYLEKPKLQASHLPFKCEDKSDLQSLVNDLLSQIANQQNSRENELLLDDLLRQMNDSDGKHNKHEEKECSLKGNHAMGKEANYIEDHLQEDESETDEAEEQEFIQEFEEEGNELEHEDDDDDEEYEEEEEEEAEDEEEEELQHNFYLPNIALGPMQQDQDEDDEEVIWDEDDEEDMEPEIEGVANNSQYQFDVIWENEADNEGQVGQQEAKDMYTQFGRMYLQSP